MIAKSVFTVCLYFIVAAYNLCCGQQPTLVLPIGHTAPITDAHFSPDGKRVITAALDSTVKVWDVATGYLLAELKGFKLDNPFGPTFNARFTLDSRHIITHNSYGYDSQENKLWDINTGEIIKDWGDSIDIMQYSIDGKYFLSDKLFFNQQGILKLWNGGTGKLIKDFGYLGQDGYAKFSPDSKYILTSDGRLGYSYTEILPRKIVIAPDGSKRIVDSGKNGPTHYFGGPAYNLWEVSSGKLIKQFDVDSEKVNTIQFNPFDKQILTLSYENIYKLWDAETGKLIKELKLRPTEIYLGQFSPNGKQIIILSDDTLAKESKGYSNRLTLWDAKTGNFFAKLDYPATYNDSVIFSPDGKRLVTLPRANMNADSSYEYKLWDVATGKLIKSFYTPNQIIIHIAFSPDSKKIFTLFNKRNVKIWETETGKLISTLKEQPLQIAFLQFSPDGNKIVTTSFSKVGNEYDDIPNSRFFEETKDTSGKNEFLNSSSNYQSGLLLKSYYKNNKLIESVGSVTKIWNAATGDLISTLEEKEETHNNFAYFSLDGKRVVMGKNIKLGNPNDIKIWDVKTGKQVYNTKSSGNRWKESTTSFETSAFTSLNPEGIIEKKKLLVKVSNGAEILDLQTGRYISLKGHAKALISAKFSPACADDSIGAKYILTAYENAEVKIWETSSGKLNINLKRKQEGILESGRYIDYAKFSPDGKKIVTITDSDSSAKIWDAKSGELITEHKRYGGRFYSAEFSPDGKTVAAVYVERRTFIVLLFDAVSGELKAITPPDNDISYVQFSPPTSSDPIGGKYILTRGDYVALWNVSKFKPYADEDTTYSFNVLTDPIQVGLNNVTNVRNHTVCFSPDGKNILEACEGGQDQLQIWDITKKKKITDPENKDSIITVITDPVRLVKEDEDYSIRFAHYSPDGKKIVAGFQENQDSSRIIIWNALTNKPMLEKLVKGLPVSAQFNKNNNRVLLIFGGYRSTSTPEILNVNTGSLVSLVGHSSEVLSVQFSPDGKRILTASSDNTSKIWDGETGKLLHTFFAVDSTDYLVVDSNFHYDGTEAARKLLYFTCGDEIISLDQVKDQLWVPNLAERIMNGETINAKKLNDLDLCGLTPLVEELTENSGLYAYTITPRRGGLGETILSINGNPTKTYHPGDLTRKGDYYVLSIPKKELSPYFIAGDNNLVSVKSYTADNSFSSRAFGNIVSNNQAVSKTPPSLYAVMVGVSDYKGTGLDLKYAAKDATDISKALSNAARKLLNTNDSNHVFMYNLTTEKDRYQLPEKTSIKKVFEEIGKKATANDILLVFFAGHGVMTGEGEKKQFYFLTADASNESAVTGVAEVGISTTELIEWMKPSNIKAQKRIMIFDACNSGQAINDLAGKDFAVRDDGKAQQIKAIDKLNEKSGLFILSASASDQSAFEMGRYAQGLLTYSLLKTIKQQPDILNEGKFLDVSKWFNAAKESVAELAKENKARQEPQIVTNTNFNIGVVDAEVIAKIILPQEKPLFAASNFQNSDEGADGDNLELSKLINLQLANIASRGGESKIIYVTATNSTDAFMLSGRYDVKGNEITIRVSVKKNNETKYRFEEKGTKEKLTELVNIVVLKAADWVSNNK